MIKLEKGFKRLAIVAMPFWIFVHGYISIPFFDNITSAEGGLILGVLVTFCLVNPLTFFYICKFIVDGFRDDD